MADNTAFHNPKYFGCWDIGTTQKDKNLVFEWDYDVIPECKIVLIRDTTKVKEYIEGDGLTRSNNNQTVTLKIQGDDLKDSVDKVLKAYCNFFVEGDTEVTFDLNVIKTYL